MSAVALLGFLSAVASLGRVSAAAPLGFVSAVARRHRLRAAIYFFSV